MKSRQRSLRRFAWIGVICVGIGITALGIWSTWYTLDAIDRTRQLVTLNEGWKQTRFWIAEEETLERKYRIERLHHDGYYHNKIAALLTQTVLRLRPISTPADNANIDSLLSANAAYLVAMRDMFRAIDAGDERRVETIHDAIDPTYDEVEHIAVAQETLYHRSAYLSLARLEKTQRFVATGFPLLAFIGGVTIVVFGRIIRDYRRETDRVISAQLEQLAQAALFDALTGLRNNRAFEEPFTSGVTDGISRHLALLDIDHFKQANDRFGHLHGDEVLRTLGKMLGDLSPAATAYRIGGDEFAVVFEGKQPEAALDELRTVLQQCASQLRGNTLSIGVATLASYESDVVALRERADIALYEAKHRGRDQIVVFEPRLLETSTSLGARRIALERVLNGERPIDIALQPIWAYGTGALIGYEALSRFSSEFSSPLDVFAAAELLDRAHALDARCLGAIAARLPAAFSGLLFVNLSPTTLLHGAAEMALNDLVRVTNLPPDRIVVELTETTAISPQAIERVAQLRGRGFRWALDDTGSGNAGLAVLTKLALDIVKIDRTLLISLDDPRVRAIASGILVMVKGLGCGVVFEGVETREHIRQCGELAREHGVAGQMALQGFGLGRPCAPDSLGRETVHPALRHGEASSVDGRRLGDAAPSGANSDPAGQIVG